MPFEYVTNLNSVVNALKNYNTTTATPYLSNSLTAAISNDNIVNLDPELVPIRADKLPAIYVRISNKDEAYDGIGPTGSSRAKKRGSVTYNIIGIYPKPQGAVGDPANVLNDIYLMARNVEGVFQQEFDLSDTALWCNPEATDFLGPFEIEGTWVKVFKMDLKAEYLFR